MKNYTVAWLNARTERATHRSALRSMGMLPVQARNDHGFIIKNVVSEGPCGPEFHVMLFDPGPKDRHLWCTLNGRAE